jgi:SAM-dependent methyltransferase
MRWDSKDVCEGFEVYRDYPEELFGYRWLLREIGQRPTSDGAERVILDYGCGPGKCSLRLATHGCGRVVAVDQSERMLEMARQLRCHDKITYLAVRNDILDIPDNSVDVAIACFVFINTESIERIDTAMRNVRRALKPSGRFYILDTNPETTGRQFSTFVSGSPGHRYEAGESRIVRLFRGDEECLRLEDYHWPKQVYSESLRRAGFSNIETFEFILEDVPEQDRNAFVNEYGFNSWKEETAHPPFIIFEASGAALGGAVQAGAVLKR